jgi:Xaa-Pro aminopeptidase
VNRRGFLTTALSTGAISGIGEPVHAETAQPPLQHTGELLINRQRAGAVMRQAGLDGIVVSNLANVYYASRFLSVLSRFRDTAANAAVIPADPSLPIALVVGSFEYYAEMATADLPAAVQVYLIGESLPAHTDESGPVFHSAGSFPADARENGRAARTLKARPFRKDMVTAMADALAERDLLHARIGVDALDARHWVEAAAPQASLRLAGDLMLHIRLIKTPAEMELMRRASRANVAAGHATARAARSLGDLRAVRQNFFEQAAARGNIGVYANVDLVVNELENGPIRDGQGFMLDVVSHYGLYQGDFGRTIFMGEPNPAIRRAAEVGATAWDHIRERLRPGVRFSSIHQMGQDVVAALGERFIYAFNPHSVGLQHWDHPQRAIDGTPIDLALEAGMVLSVDCPLLNTGVNGSTHMEDLVLITADGCETIHPTPEPWLVV